MVMDAIWHRLCVRMWKGDLFVPSWVRVRRVRLGSISSELCGGGVHNILLLPLVASCLETIDVCIWRMFVFCLLYSGQRPLLTIVFFSLVVLKYVVFSVCNVRRGAVGSRLWEVCECFIM